MLLRSKKRVQKAIRPKPVRLNVEQLEDRITPSGPGGGDGTQQGPFSPSGVLGALTLNSGDSANFNTLTGQYQIDGGAWQPGGILSPDPNQTTMLFNFTTINLAAGSTVMATGSNALGLLGTGNIVINTSLNFSGQAGGNGANGYGHIGGGGAGGGGGGGAIIIDTSGGSITDSAMVDTEGGNPGQDGAGWLSGSDNGGAGGSGGSPGVGGGGGGSGGSSIAGGQGGRGGNGSTTGPGGGGGGGGGGINGGTYGNGGNPSPKGGNFGTKGGDAGWEAGQGGKGGYGGNYDGEYSGGDGGAGSGTYGKAGEDGDDAEALGGGGGGGGGGADADPGKKGATPGGPSQGGDGDAGGAEGGQPGSYVKPKGAGGGGAMAFVAPSGITLTGQMIRGDGDAVVYGTLLSSTSYFVDGAPAIDTYAEWEALTASNYYLDAGGGGGGDGAAGQLTYVPSITGISPTSGPSSGGTTVTITGTHLGDTTFVDFGSTPASSFTIVSDTQITAVSPAESPGTVDITAGNATGTSATSPADQFTFTGSPGPLMAGPLTTTNGGTSGSSSVSTMLSAQSSIASADLVRIAQILNALDLASFNSEDSSMVRSSVNSGKTLYPVTLLGSNMAGWTSQTRMSESLQQSSHSDVQSLDMVFADLVGKTAS